MRSSSELSRDFNPNTYLAMRISIAFLGYLILMGICLALNPDESNPLLMATCACASLVFTVTFCVVCFDAFTKVKKITQAENDTSTADSTDEIATAAKLEENKNETAGNNNSLNSNCSVNSTSSNDSSNSKAHKDRCAALGKKYGLTKRETEVFGLLLEGKNARDIENILYISRYTAKTHIGSVYRKIDVHSQQDLIDMFSQEGSHAE